MRLGFKMISTKMKYNYKKKYKNRSTPTLPPSFEIMEYQERALCQNNKNKDFPS